LRSSFLSFIFISFFSFKNISMFRYLFGIPGPSGFGSGTTATDIATAFQERIKDRVFFITGANSGIGFHSALVLAKFGATVVLACRSKDVGVIIL
jgi:hypothetical protein